VHAARTFGITLVSPLLLDNSAQARAGAGYDKRAFAIDFDARQATCPQGVTSSSWSPCRQHNDEAIVVSWPKDACTPCPARQLCTSAQRRQVTIRPRELHEALATARSEQATAQWKARYAARADVEGTMRQATHVTGIRRARYLGFPRPGSSTTSPPPRQHDPPRCLLDRLPPGPHANKPPRPPRPHPYRLTE
jgi:hypothetical protein